jgi:hypothetical protein
MDLLTKLLILVLVVLSVVVLTPVTYRKKEDTTDHYYYNDIDARYIDPIFPIHKTSFNNMNNKSIIRLYLKMFETHENDLKSSDTNEVDLAEVVRDLSIILDLLDMIL